MNTKAWILKMAALLALVGAALFATPAQAGSGFGISIYGGDYGRGYDISYYDRDYYGRGYYDRGYYVPYRPYYRPVYRRGYRSHYRPYRSHHGYYRPRYEVYVHDHANPYHHYPYRRW